MRLSSVKTNNLFLLICGICVASLFPAFISAATITQDLKGNLGIMDPGTIEKCDGSYYVFGTHGGNLTSPDRINWSSPSENPTAVKQSWWSAHGGDIWALDATVKNGTYYCYYSVSASMNFSSAVGLTTSPSLDPKKCKWTDQGIIIDSVQAADGGKMVNVIDPSTFTDDDGKWYLSFGSFQNGCRLAEINPLTGKLVNNPPHPIKVTNHAGEGSAMFKYAKYYYYAISQGKCCSGAASTYHITYGRSATIGGPYLTKSGGSMMTSTVENLLDGTENHSQVGGCVAVGVGGFFWDGRGTDDLDTLFLDFNGYSSTGTALYIKPVYVDASGWLSIVPPVGTVITRKKGVAVKQLDLTMKTASKSPIAVRMITSGNHANIANTSMYSITGQRVLATANGQMPMGIYIEKKIVGK